MKILTVLMSTKGLSVIANSFTATCQKCAQIALLLVFFDNGSPLFPLVQWLWELSTRS